MRRSKRSCFVYIYQLNAHQFSFKHFYIPNSFSFYAFNTSPLRPHAKLRNKYTARPLTSFQVPTLLSLYYLMGYWLIYYYFFKKLFLRNIAIMPCTDKTEIRRNELSNFSHSFSQNFLL